MPGFATLLTATKEILRPEYSSTNDVDQIEIIPSTQILNNQWLKRYMAGPWIENGEPLTIENIRKKELLEKDIYRRISEIRNEIANEKRIPPNRVCSRQELNDICKLRPTTEASLFKIEGMTIRKIKSLNKMLLFITTFSTENHLETNLNDDNKPQKTPNTFPVS